MTPFCASCVEWMEAQLQEKPRFSKRQHIDRCPCDCHGPDSVKAFLEGARDRTVIRNHEARFGYSTGLLEKS